MAAHRHRCGDALHAFGIRHGTCGSACSACQVCGGVSRDLRACPHSEQLCAWRQPRLERDSNRLLFDGDDLRHRCSVRRQLEPCRVLGPGPHWQSGADRGHQILGCPNPWWLGGGGSCLQHPCTQHGLPCPSGSLLRVSRNGGRGHLYIHAVFRGSELCGFQAEQLTDRWQPVLRSCDWLRDCCRWLCRRWHLRCRFQPCSGHRSRRQACWFQLGHLVRLVRADRRSTCSPAIQNCEACGKEWR
mmetsp:Transcript_133037/g.344254  ORF Transcript_133037/g.344254 Transcript_133037/m.344254 type:complete len:244 (+) Transcript_133037:339-1070(+)